MKKLLFFISLFSLTFKIQAQEESKSITTSLPFLLISSDARAGGMGEAGVATSSDAFALFHNPAKIAFNKNALSIGANYVPWLRNLTEDIFAGNLSVVHRINETSGWGADLKYFSLGQIERTNEDGLPTGYTNPSEFALSGYYAMKLSEKFSMSVGLKYINSNLDIDDSFSAINSFGVDISGYYQSDEENYGSFNGRYRLGFNIANIGPKVEYTAGEENFIPTIAKIGGGFDFIFDDFNTLGLNLEFRKLLVPSSGTESSRGWFEGMFTSLGDRNFSEELQEVNWTLGAEYLYNDAFAVRAGYFHESEVKGNRQYFTLGAGFKARAFSLDLSYLMNASDVNNPLENTLRFSLAFDLGEIYEDY
ncbi:type IX secretion system outer membrane channel protein PorV [Tenacibaculum sp. IB213877]|uniref:type IX secretion system outer membrane channel protein PorV n=1 Tax=Tenacibaculum sp. IB213877 TaxID=3097351 RepID=UPI002A59F990|nr:type IX secretion system outer membrane channel protein PorV [Tenacibaculum sp. IB213877]MDY0781384.1 type IX secretion system outer membrane channel protein PorV [Tenacibaculum sp. IB213877]